MKIRYLVWVPLKGLWYFILYFTWYFIPLFDCHLEQEIEKHTMLKGVTSKNTVSYISSHWRYPRELEISTAMMWVLCFFFWFHPSEVCWRAWFILFHKNGKEIVSIVGNIIFNLTQRLRNNSFMYLLHILKAKATVSHWISGLTLMIDVFSDSIMANSIHFHDSERIM